jgi:hypothetical protein
MVTGIVTGRIAIQERQGTVDVDVENPASGRVHIKGVGLHAA